MNQSLGCFACNLGSILHCLNGIFNQRRCILRSLRTLTGQISNLICNHCKSLSCTSCSGCLHCCIQSKNIRLECNVFNGLDDLSDLTGTVADILHSPNHILHLCVALIHLIPNYHYLPIGIGSIFCIFFNPV